MSTRITISTVVLWLWSMAALAQQPVGTTFTVAGQLNQAGNPAVGSFDFQFEGFDGESAGNSVSSTVTFNAVDLGDGSFRFDVDFGEQTFLGDAVFLEVRVRESGTSSFTTLSPRQRLNANPYAIYSLTADMAVSAMSVAYTDITDRPAGLDDGDDDTLDGLSCAAGEIAKYNGASWACNADLDTDTNSDTLADLSCGTDQIARYDGAQWMCGDDVDTTDPNTDTLADLACGTNQIARFDGGQWMCSDDVDTTDPNTDTLADLACGTNQIARFDGNNWVCDDETMAGGGSSIANVIRVASSGGDFTSVAAALASISDASASNPYLVDVGPGVFNETDLVLVPGYVHLHGAGPEITVISSTRTSASQGSSAATAQVEQNGRISNLTIENLGTGNFGIGIYALDDPFGAGDVTRDTVIKMVHARATAPGDPNPGIARYGVLLVGAEPSIIDSTLRGAGAFGFGTAINAALVVNHDDDGGFPQPLIVGSTLLGAEDSTRLGECTDPSGTGIAIAATDATIDVRDSYVCGGHRALKVTGNTGGPQQRFTNSTIAVSSTGSAFLFEVIGTATAVVARSQVLYASNKFTGTGGLVCIDNTKSGFVNATDSTSSSTACN